MGATRNKLERVVLEGCGLTVPDNDGLLAFLSSHTGGKLVLDHHHVHSAATQNPSSGDKTNASDREDGHDEKVVYH